MCFVVLYMCSILILRIKEINIHILRIKEINIHMDLTVNIYMTYQLMYIDNYIHILYD